MADLIDRTAFMNSEFTCMTMINTDGTEVYLKAEDVAKFIMSFPAVDAVEVSQIKAYLQRKLDEWNALGDRKFEPANMWGYNFIMACFDDLSSYGERRGDNG